MKRAILVILVLVGGLYIFQRYKTLSSSYRGPGTFLGNLSARTNDWYEETILGRKLVKTTSVTPSQVVNAPVVQNKMIGDEFNLWGIEYQVISASLYQPAYQFQKTSGKYIAVRIKATNIGKEESGLNTIYVEDDNGRQYKQAVLGYRQLDVEDYGFKNIQPGFTETLGAIFEVAKDSDNIKLNYPSAQGPVVVTVDLKI